MLRKEAHRLDHYMHSSVQKINSFKTKFINKFGYCADPPLPDWENLENYYRSMPASSYFLCATNQVYHNYLPADIQVPHGVERFLGLGLKYCIQAARPHPKLSRSFARFKNDVRCTAYFVENPPT